MKGIFNLVYKSGPHGDEMTTYTLDIMPNITLEKFVVSVISNELEWGKIRVHYLDKNMKNFDCATFDEKYSLYFDIKYNYGHIVNITDMLLWDKYRNTMLTNNNYNWINGGWSCMNYYIRIN